VISSPTKTAQPRSEGSSSPPDSAAGRLKATCTFAVDRRVYRVHWGPILFSWHELQQIQRARPPVFVGFENYKYALFGDELGCLPLSAPSTTPRSRYPSASWARFSWQSC